LALNQFKVLTNPIINYFGSRRIKNHFSEIPIIIGGCGRSGTTLLLAILDAHPNIYGIPIEIGMFTEWDEIKKENGIGTKYVPRRMDRLHRYFLINRIPKRNTRWCEKTPTHVISFRKIIDFYERQVKVINMVRDGRDVLVSRHPEDPTKYWVPINRWVRDIRAGMDVMDSPNVLTVRYEDIVSNYPTTIKNICTFINEECTDQLFNWFDHTKVRKNTAWFQPVQKIHTQSVGKWQNEKNKDRVAEIMGRSDVVDLLKRLKYI